MGTTNSPIKQVAVAGLGTMGAGLAQELADHGFEVLGYDPAPGALERSGQQVVAGLRLLKLLSKQRATPPEGVVQRITYTDKAADLAEADFVIECAPERFEIKAELFRQLDEIVAPGAVFASNTSAIPITRLASCTGRPRHVLGMHFMNPVPMKSRVEVVRAVHTSDESLASATELLSAMGKHGVVVNDAAGFVSNRVLMLTVNEAAYLLLEGTASAAQVDEVFRGCLGHPMGPLETADLIGLDVVLDSLDVLFEHYRDPKFRPCPLLTRLVHAGHHGRKSGKGFHTTGAAAAG